MPSSEENGEPLSSLWRMSLCGSESVATLDRVSRLEDHVTLGELGRIDEAF